MASDKICILFMAIFLLLCCQVIGGSIAYGSIYVRDCGERIKRKTAEKSEMLLLEKYETEI